MSNLGSDLSCVSDCSPDMAEVSGRTCYIQAIARRYITPRGRLIDDKDYGFDLTQYVNDDLAPIDIARIQAGAEAEALKDERTEAVTVNIVLNAAGVLIIRIELDDGDGPFSLVLSVSEVSVTVLSVK